MSLDTQVVPFSFNSHEVRIIDRNGDPWFVAKDICDALGYVNSSKAVADHLDDDERSTITNGDSRNGGGKLTIISESGLNALVLRSRKPEARKFAKWVTSKVLPAIRKTGRYADPSSLAVTSAPSLIARRWLMTFDAQGREHATPVSDGALLLTITELADVIAEPGALMPSNAELATLAKACNDRLAMRLNNTIKRRAA